jgi:hypothetical protein
MLLVAVLSACRYEPGPCNPYDPGSGVVPCETVDLCCATTESACAAYAPDGTEYECEGGNECAAMLFEITCDQCPNWTATGGVCR